MSHQDSTPLSSAEDEAYREKTQLAVVQLAFIDLAESDIGILLSACEHVAAHLQEGERALRLIAVHDHGIGLLVFTSERILYVKRRGALVWDSRKAGVKAIWTHSTGKYRLVNVVGSSRKHDISFQVSHRTPNLDALPVDVAALSEGSLTQRALTQSRALQHALADYTYVQLATLRIAEAVRFLEDSEPFLELIPLAAKSGWLLFTDRRIIRMRLLFFGGGRLLFKAMPYDDIGDVDVFTGGLDTHISIRSSSTRRCVTVSFNRGGHHERAERALDALRDHRTARSEAQG